MNNIDLMDYWIESSDEDYNVMLDLKEKNRNTGGRRSGKYTPPRKGRSRRYIRQNGGRSSRYV